MLRLWEETCGRKVVGSNPSTVYWMDIFRNNLMCVKIVMFFVRKRPEINKKEAGKRPTLRIYLQLRLKSFTISVRRVWQFCTGEQASKQARDRSAEPCGMGEIIIQSSWLRERKSSIWRHLAAKKPSKLPLKIIRARWCQMMMVINLLKPVKKRETLF